MARLFDGTNDSLTATVDLSGTQTFTIACWFYWDAYAGDNDMLFEHTADSDAGTTGWVIDPNSGSGKFSVAHLGDVGQVTARVDRPSAATWHHLVVNFDKSAATNEVAAIYFDGVSQAITYAANANNTNNFANDTLNFFSRNNTTFFGAGRLAEVAIWRGINLDASEAAALVNFVPLLVRPTSLDYYWPLQGRFSPEIELMGGAGATVNGAVATDHPRVFAATAKRTHARAHAAPVVIVTSPAVMVPSVPPVFGPHSTVAAQHTNWAMTPFANLNVTVLMGWAKTQDFPQAVKSPSWPSAHLVRESVGAPHLIESPGWFPVGGQLAQRAPAYPPPPATGFITPTSDFATFPFVPPWLLPLKAITRRFDFTVAGKLVEIAPGPPPPFVPPPVPVANCALTLGELKGRVYEQLDDDGTYYTGNEVRHALNAAQNLFGYLTLCKEKTANLTTTAATCFHQANLLLTDYILPLRVTTAAGARIRPATIHQLDGESSTWRNTAGTPSRYVAMGYDLIGLTPQYANATVIRITYAATPTAMVADTDTADIPEEQHIWLVDYACWWLRLKEGGQELANAAEWLQRFVLAARKYGDFVRRRSYGQKYDHVPFDLSSFDTGRLDIVLPGQKQQRRSS